MVREKREDIVGHDDWSRAVKAYYRDVEDYDWVDVADHLRGPEAIFHRLRARLIRRVLADHSAERFLDAGCGTGLNLRHLPMSSVGLDLNARNINVVRLRYPQYKSVVGDIEGMPFGTGEFDGVLCTEVLEHVPNPGLALGEIRRVLRRGGVLVGTVPGRSPIWKLRFLSSTCPVDEPFHNQYSVAEVVGMLSDFEIGVVRHVIFGSNVLFVVHKQT